MNNKNKIVCERFEMVMNSDFMSELLKKSNSSVRDVIKAQDNFNSYIMNFLYVYLKLIDTNRYLIEDLKYFTELYDISRNESVCSITSKIIIMRLEKMGTSRIEIKNRILNELLDNRLYLYCDNGIDNYIEEDLNKIISIFSLYGKERLFEYVKIDNELFHYLGNFNYGAYYCYTNPEWLYFLLGEAFICRDKKAAFSKLNDYIKNFDLATKNYIINYFEKIWNYYNAPSNKPSLLFFEGNNVDNITDEIYFSWNSNRTDTNNLAELLSALSFINNKCTNKKVNPKLFKKVAMPELDKIVDLKRQRKLKRY